MPTVNIIYLFIIFIFYFIMALEDCFVIIRRHRNALYYLTIFVEGIIWLLLLNIMTLPDIAEVIFGPELNQ